MVQLIHLAHNYVNAQVDSKGFTRFYRFTEAQIKVYRKSPVFRLMAQSSAGVYLSFTTTGSELRFQCKKQSLVKSMIKEMGIIKSIFAFVINIDAKLHGSNFHTSDAMTDYFDIIVNGKLISSVKPINGKITVQLGNASKEPIQVKVYLPYLHVVKIKDFIANGEIAFDNIKKESIFCIGDSITQGCFVGKPSLSYVARLGEALNVDALNLGVSGYIYDAESLNGLDALPKPKFITVAYGTNDWTQIPDMVTLRKNVSAYYTKLLKLYSDIPIYVITPIWREDMNIRRSCGEFIDVAHLIEEEVRPYSNITLIDGLSLTPHDKAYYADGYLHPNDQGFAYLTQKLLSIINNSAN